MFSPRRFNEAGIGLSALALMMPAIAGVATGDDAELRAGAGRSNITLTGLFPIDEFTAEHDPLSTRVLLTERGLVSADLAGAVSHYVERHFGDSVVAFYLVGCAGDQAPYLQASRHVVHDDGSVGRTDEHVKGFLLLALLGEKLGEEVIRITQSIKPEPANVFRIERHLIALNGLRFTPHNAATGPVTTFHYVPGTPVSLPVVLIQWGKIVMVGVQPELSAILGERIRAASPFAQTLVLTMVDGAAKYVPDISGYQRFTYEARSSPFAPGEGEHAVQAIVSLLTHLRALPA